VAAGDDEPEERRLGRIVGEAGGEQVAFEVVDADQRPAREPGEPLGGLHPDEQRADEPRPAGHGDGVEVGEAHARLDERLVDDRQHLHHVVARGELGDDPAPAPVHLDLR